MLNPDDYPKFKGTLSEMSAAYNKFMTNNPGAVVEDARKAVGIMQDNAPKTKTPGEWVYYGRAGSKKKMRLNTKSSAKMTGAEARGDNLPVQTHGDNDFKPKKSDPQTGYYEESPDGPTGAKLKDHHIRPPGIYETFFDGLTPEEASELARYASEDLMKPLGNKSGNRARISHNAHDRGYHLWDRKYKDGALRPQGSNRYTIPNNTPLEARKELLRQFMLTEGAKMDQALFVEQMADKHPLHPDWKEQQDTLRQFDDTLFNQAPSPMSRNPLVTARRNATLLAGIGLTTASWFGTGVSAAETVTRGKIAMETKDPADIAQTGLSAVSTAADLVPPVPGLGWVAAGVSQGADWINKITDEYRFPSEPVPDPVKGYTSGRGAGRSAFKQP